MAPLSLDAVLKKRSLAEPLSGSSSFSSIAASAGVPALE